MEIEGERKPVAEGREWGKKRMGGVNPGDVVEKVAGVELVEVVAWVEVSPVAVLGGGCGGSGTGGPLAISVPGGGLAEGNAVVSASAAL